MCPFDGLEGSKTAAGGFWSAGSTRGVFFAVQRMVYQRSQRRTSVSSVSHHQHFSSNTGEIAIRDQDGTY